MSPLGELICLATALLWAVAVTMFRRPIVDHGARTVNLVKCLFGALLQGLTVLLLGLGPEVLEASRGSLLLLALSGVVGLVLGDTALFGSVARIGVHRALLLQTLAPVFAALLAAVWLAEFPASRQVVGAAVILFGVGLVVAPRERGALRAPEVRRAGNWAATGIALGVLAALGQGAGLVLAKAGMHDLAPLPASFVRLAAAALGLVLLAAVSGRLGRLRGLGRDAAARRHVFPAAFLGTYLALFLMMAGVALAPTSVAAVLLATSPVFSLVIGSVIERRWPSPAGVVGTLLAVAGVGILTTGGPAPM